jgi:hypothetical protein
MRAAIYTAEPFNPSAVWCGSSLPARSRSKTAGPYDGEALEELHVLPRTEHHTDAQIAVRQPYRHGCEADENQRGGSRPQADDEGKGAKELGNDQDGSYGGRIRHTLCSQ